MNAQPIELYPGQHREHEKRMKLIAMQSETLRKEVFASIIALSEAGNYPLDSRRPLEEAMRATTRAYAAACVLDPVEPEEL